MRIAYLQYLEEQLEGQLLAVVPATLRMPRHIAATTLLTQLILSHTTKTEDLRTTGELIHLAKRTSYNHAERTIRFVVADHQTAAWHMRKIRFHGERLQLLSKAKMAELDNRADLGTAAADKNALKYSLRVLADSIPATKVMQILGSCTERKLLSLRRYPKNQQTAYGPNFFVAIYETTSCPPELEGVTHITAGRHSLFLHHHRMHPWIPCFQCFSPEQSSTQCTGTATRRRCVITEISLLR